MSRDSRIATNVGRLYCNDDNPKNNTTLLCYKLWRRFIISNRDVELQKVGISVQRKLCDFIISTQYSSSILHPSIRLW